MASKKYTLAMALLGLLQTASFAQSTPGSASDAYVFDSSKVSTKHLPQYNEFQKSAYPYPARPKDGLELGGGVGWGNVLGDHSLFHKSSAGHTNDGGVSGTITLRKAISHTFSLRGGYTGAIISIGNQNYGNGPLLPSARTMTHSVGVDLVASLNSISHYRGNPKVDYYVFGGYDLAATYVRTWQGNGYHTLYAPQYNIISTFGGTANPGTIAPGRKDWSLLHAIDFGAGLAFKINAKFNIALEQKFMAPMFSDDYLDGVKSGLSGDSWSFTTVRLNMNLGNSATHVEPLWWLNPNNYIYSEINKPSHLKITPILPDADGDGVTDQFDLEPNTPAGAAVDTHGRALDTDGDGVPDYRDKEKLTPQSCFPVNADGVGTCPEPACCTELRKKIEEDEENGKARRTNCNLTSLPSVTFKAGSYKLSKDAQAILVTAATQLKANATCNVKVVGYVTDASKKAQQLSWDRVNSVIKYLVEQQGIAESRIIFSYDTTGSSNSVDLLPTTETGPNTVPAPALHLRSNK